MLIKKWIQILLKMVTYFHSLFYFFLAFKFTGITNNEQRKSIDEKVMDLFVSYDTDEYIHLEKRRLRELQKEIKKII